MSTSDVDDLKTLEETYTVKLDDNLYSIAESFAKGLGVGQVNNLWKEIKSANRALFAKRLNTGDFEAYVSTYDNASEAGRKELDDPYLILPGDQLHIPTLDKGQKSSDKQPILVGSIIHLENGLPDGGGYLDTNGWIIEKKVFTNWHDPRMRGLVSTHGSNNRAMGSGSWQILSADGKENGEELEIGDKIHLYNMHMGAGYLDTFEWVRYLKPFLNKQLSENAKKLAPFKDYEDQNTMAIGVFTSSAPRQGDGLSATWTIESAGTKINGDTIYEGDQIYLHQFWRLKRFLHAYNGDITIHPDFNKEYGPQQGFVLINPPYPKADEARKWKITLNKFPQYLYRFQYKQGDKLAPWHNAGVFKIGDPAMEPIKALNITSSDGGETLDLTVTYDGEDNPSESPNFIANHRQQNFYDVDELRDAGTEDSNEIGQWCFGARESQKIVQMNITSSDNGHTFKGKMTYQGEVGVDIIGNRGDTELDATIRLLRDYFQPDVLRQRTKKIEGVIDATYKLIAATFNEISKKSFVDAVAPPVATQATDNVTSAAEHHPDQRDNLIEPIDYQLQRNQLLNLFVLSEILNSFFRDTLQELMRQSLDHHQLAQTLPPLHLIRECFQRFATDHEIVQQATAQRRWIQSVEVEDDRYFMGENLLQLLVMDKLAIKALRPFQHLLEDHPEELAIVTYLSDRTHIRRVPYTKQCIVLGVSYDRLPPAPDFFDDEEFDEHGFYGFELMAIPHEVAHYVYQHGKIGSETFTELSKKFEGNPYYRWCEEIFADVYGCIVAGPLAVLSMQALLVSIDGDRAWNNDEEHPTPVVRLFILSEILRHLQEERSRKPDYESKESKRDSVDELTQKLDTKWRKILERWGYDQVGEYEHQEWNRGRKKPTFLKDQGRPERVYMHNQSAQHLETIINVDRVVSAVRPMIVEFANHLLKAYEDAEISKKDGDLSIAIPWSESYEKNLSDYYAAMDTLTNREFAKTEVAQRVPLTIKVDAQKPVGSNSDKSLQQYLKDWDDKGPFGWGPH